MENAAAGGEDSDWFRVFAAKSPIISQHVQATLTNDFVKAYDHEPYRIYARREKLTDGSGGHALKAVMR